MSSYKPDQPHLENPEAQNKYWAFANDVTLPNCTQLFRKEDQVSKLHYTTDGKS